MHRNRISILTAPAAATSINKGSSSPRLKSPKRKYHRSTRTKIFVWLLLFWILCWLIPYLRLLSVTKHPTKSLPAHDSFFINETLPILYQQTPQHAQLPLPPIHSSHFLIFKGFMKGQGTGNFMNGLLATHLLALEFNRTVCVSPDYKDFHLAFEPRRPAELHELCAPILQQYNDNIELRIMLNNFGKIPNECQLQKQLAAIDELPVVVILANTYPRWPAVPDDFFFTHYQPTRALMAMLPYETSPHTVVHLRQPDKKGIDDRKGLDLASFQQLNQMLSPKNNTYLVTNNVAWYPYFPTWQHPSWTVVQHTATSKYWGDVPKDDVALKHERQVLQMWVDWYTILSAQYVVHTASDFSHSAIHWQNIPSHEINGLLPNGTLDLRSESWIRDGVTSRLVDRRLDAPNNADLRRCKHDETGQWD